MSIPSPVTRSNFRSLYADVAWFGVLAGSAVAFLNIYAARLGAGAIAIGLLTAGPAVINLLFSLPSGRWLEGRPLIPITFWSAVLARLGYVLMIFLPWLAAGQAQVGWLVALTLLFSAPGVLLAISFNSLLAEVVPVELRAEVVGRRNALLAITQTLVTLVSGQVLDRLAFPLNYQVVFAIGAVGGLLSAWYLGRLRVDPQLAGREARPALPDLALTSGSVGGPPEGDLPEQAPGEPRPAERRGAAPAAQLIRQLSRPARALNLELLRGPFGRFMAAYLLFYTFQNLAFPLFPIRLVNTLQLNDGMIALGNALFYATMFLVSLRLGWLARRFGHHRLLWSSGMALSLYPLLIGLAGGVPLYLAASLVGGVVWGVLSASLANRLMERVPAESRPAGMAFHNLSYNLGILIGSLSGPLLGGVFGIQETILAAAGLRLLAGVLLLVWG
ncbi:MAG: MFS transporter [Chloroflexota bacterium]